MKTTCIFMQMALGNVNKIATAGARSPTTERRRSFHYTMPRTFCQVEICTNFILFLSHYLCNIFCSSLLQFSVSVLYYNCSKGTGRAYWTGGRQTTTSPLRDRPKKINRGLTKSHPHVKINLSNKRKRDIKWK